MAKKKLKEQRIAMSVDKKDFYGKEVTDAIKSACESLDVSQEMLDIEVVETGSTGIFGLIRKKARIRVSRKDEASSLQGDAEETTVTIEEPVVPVVAETKKEEPRLSSRDESVEDSTDQQKSTPEPTAAIEETVESVVGDDDDDNSSASSEDEVDASSESLDIVKAEVAKLVELMGFPSNVDVSAKGLAVSCSITGEFDEELAGPEGKTLDSIQYLIRKMVARKCDERLRLTINVGDFRERRLEELKERAMELASKVKETGKTHVLPALNPSERREIHMVLQEDKEVRSRSVGDGLFKKILIYKPGKGNRGGRRKSNPRNRRGRGNKNGNSSSEE